MLRRKATAAMSAIRDPGGPPSTAPALGTHISGMSRSSTAPHGLPSVNRAGRGSLRPQNNAALAETIAFGRRSPLPASPSMSTVHAMNGRPPAAFYAIAANELNAMMGRPQAGFAGRGSTPHFRTMGGDPPWGGGGAAHAASTQQFRGSGGHPYGATLSHSLPVVGDTSGGGGGGSAAHHAAAPFARSQSRGGGMLTGERSSGASSRNLLADGGHHGRRADDGPVHGHRDATAAESRPGKQPSAAAAAAADADEADASQLQDELDDLADRLAQVERVTSMLTPEYTASLQRKLQASFSSIGERMLDIDSTLLTEAQKRSVAAAVAIQAASRGLTARVRYRLAQLTIRSWRSRELADVAAPIVAWIRRRETVDEKISQLHRGWNARILGNAQAEWRRLAVEGRPVRRTLDDELRARRHYRFSLCRRVWGGWQRIAHQAHLSEVRWVTRNGRRVALRKEVALSMESHLKAWRQWTYVMREVRRRWGHLALKEASKAFYGLRTVCQRRRHLRRLAISRWRDHGRAYFQVPFRAWYLFMVDSKILKRVRAMLIGSFHRKAIRRGLSQLLNAWHEYTVHKTVEMRSRSQLRASLRAQEALTAAGEEALDEYAKVLVEAERSLEAESRTQLMLARQAEEARGELASLRLKCHTAQQECLRLRTVVRHYELRYPRAFQQSALTQEATQAMEVPTVGGGGNVAPPDLSEAEPGSEDAAGAGAAGVVLPAPPLIVSRGEAERLQRLSLASDAMLGKHSYVPPLSGGTQADAELRRVRTFLNFVLTGILPDKPTLELMDLHEETLVQMGIREVAGAAQVLSADGSSLRPMSLPGHLAPKTPAGGDAAEGGAPPGAAEVAVAGLDRLAYSDNAISAAELHTVPQGTDGLDSAEAVAARVRARREELQARVRHSVNLYAADEAEVVVTAEEAAEKEAQKADGSAALAGALTGF
jgi:hypothetical protein